MEVMTKPFATLLLSTLLIGAGCASPSLADPLDEVKKSSSMLRFKESTEDSNSKESLKRWIRRDSGYDLIFKQQRGPLNLNNWVAPTESKYFPGREGSKRVNEYVIAQRVYSYNKVDRITVRVLVAHPKYAELASMRLIHEFAKLFPPQLKTDYELGVNIQGINAKAYRTDRGEVSLTLEVDPGIFVALEAPNWKNLQDVLTMAEQLDISRLRAKLAN